MDLLLENRRPNLARTREDDQRIGHQVDAARQYSLLADPFAKRRRPMNACRYASLFVLALSVAALAGGAACAQQVPVALAAPGETVVATFHAEGAQIYDCKADAGGKLAWQFREPIATLLRDGMTVGRHYAGPNWEASDGSAVTGKAVANVPGTTPSDIPWLKLDVTA